MNIRKIIREEIRKIVSENYPAGAQYDSNAPWNQKDNPPGTKADNIDYELIWTDDSEFAFFKDAVGNTYVAYIDSIDRDDLASYADREESFEGYDEDGDPMIDYSDDWEIDGEVIENYINDINPSIGKGLSGYEDAEYDLVMLDDELRQELLTVAKYMDEKYKQSYVDVVSGNINESGVTDLVNQQTMDTPTGTLFMMSMGEGSKKKDKTINESKNIQIKNFPYQDDLDGILDMCFFVIRKVARDLLPKIATKEDMKDLFIGESFQPDGSDAFEPTGIMNFYIGNYPSHLIDKTVSYVKYILGEMDIKVGETLREGDRVIRIPIVSNNHEGKNHPEINLSNSNARDVFEDVIGYESVDEEMDAVDLLMKIQSARKNILNKPETSSYEKRDNIYTPSHGKDYYNRTLDRIEELAQWAVDNGYRTLYVV